MKNMRISATENVIEMEFQTPAEATRLYERLLNFEQERCVVTGKNLTYDVSDVKFTNLILIVRDLFCKSFKDGRIEHQHIDLGVPQIFKHTTIVLDDGKLFKITLFNNRGTIGKYGFGCWQYGKILNLNDSENSFNIRLRNSNLDEQVQELEFTEDIDVLIEIGEIQF